MVQLVRRVLREVAQAGVVDARVVEPDLASVRGRAAAARGGAALTLAALLRALSITGHRDGLPIGSRGARYDAGTSGSTSAARCGPGCSAWTCWSGSSGACTPRMRGGLRS